MPTKQLPDHLEKAAAVLCESITNLKWADLVGDLLANKYRRAAELVEKPILQGSPDLQAAVDRAEKAEGRVKWLEGRCDRQDERWEEQAKELVARAETAEGRVKELEDRIRAKAAAYDAFGDEEIRGLLLALLPGKEEE